MTAAGEPSDDPGVLVAEPPGTLLPTGGRDHGHKGYNLALAIEALSQGLVGPRPRRPADRLGRFGLRPGHGRHGAFGGADELRPADRLHRRGLPRQPAGARRRCACACPGERALALKRRALADGVRLYPGIMSALQPWAERLGVALPRARG